MNINPIVTHGCRIEATDHGKTDDDSAQRVGEHCGNDVPAEPGLFAIRGMILRQSRFFRPGARRRAAPRANRARGLRSPEAGVHRWDRAPRRGTGPMRRNCGRNRAATSPCRASAAPLERGSARVTDRTSPGFTRRVGDRLGHSARRRFRQAPSSIVLPSGRSAYPERTTTLRSGRAASAFRPALRRHARHGVVGYSKSTGSRARMASAASPSSACRTSWPISGRTVAVFNRTIGSSSTARMRWEQVWGSAPPAQPPARHCGSGSQIRRCFLCRARLKH